MKKPGAVGMVAMVLTVVGGLNWGLVGLFEFNLVEAIFGDGGVTRLIYVLVGVSALYVLAWAFMKSDN